MNGLKKNLLNFAIVLAFGLVPALACQYFAKKPSSRNIHVTSFRYGKDPSVIRCNRGDTLHLTFSSDDTGHSFFLEEFNIDVKVTPGQEEVAVFRTDDPSEKPLIAHEVTLVVKHPALLNYLIAKSNYRCHVWCGPMHAFEQGKLVLFPNTLLFFSLGCLTGILFLWLRIILKSSGSDAGEYDPKAGYKDLLQKNGLLRKLVVSRWPQAILLILTMLMIYVVILTTVLGTKVSGRNLGVLMMWAIWLFVLVAILTPLGGRIWCTICPLPFFGDLLQRRSFFTPLKGKTNGNNNKFFGLSLKWPAALSNSWLRLFVFLTLATFSTTLVAIPRVSGIAVLMLLLVPTFMALIWEHRSFCRYVCPVSVFVSPFAGTSFLALRNKSQQTCDNCKPHFCQKGNNEGWACPYGLNVGELKESLDCGLCMECMRSCTYNNVSLYKRPFGSETGTRTLSEAWVAISIFTIAIIYSVLYHGHWPVVRDYVNIMDKQNWSLFGVYAIIVWTISLVIVPGIIWLLSMIPSKISEKKLSVKFTFLNYAGALLPLGLLLWIAFVIPMLFVNKTFIMQSASDPFGWGWDFFGTANIPWHQLLPQYIPWFQSVMILTGFYFSLKNIRKSWKGMNLRPAELIKVSIPIALLVTAVSVVMIIFFTN